MYMHDMNKSLIFDTYALLSLNNVNEPQIKTYYV